MGGIKGLPPFFFLPFLETTKPGGKKEVLPEGFLGFLGSAKLFIFTFSAFFVISSQSIYRDWETDRKSTRLNSSHSAKSRMPSSA